jgi:type I restriction enzyme S subunit
MNETNGLPKLPHGWSLTTLGDVVNPTRPKVSPISFPNLPFIGMEHVEAHTMKLLGTVPASSMKSNAVHFFPHDVLYGRLRPYLNKVLCPEFEGLCSSEFIVFPANEAVSSKFIQYFLNTLDFVVFASRLNEGDRPRVDFSLIAPYPIKLPPLPEQQRIVTKIEELFTKLDAGVDALRKARAQLKRYRQAVLKAAVTGELTREWREAHRGELEPAARLLARILTERRARWERDQLARMQAAGKQPKNDDWKQKYQEPAAPDTSELPELPEGWMWTNVEQVGEITGGLTKNQKRKKLPLKMPYLRVANVYAGELDLTEVNLSEVF